jgi:hypothetical protein
LRVSEVVLEEAGAVRLKTLRADEGVVPLRSEANVGCDFVDEGTLPPPKLERQLSFLLESSWMKAQKTAIAGLRQ